MDLFDPVTYEFYEVKSIGVPRLITDPQMDKYERATIPQSTAKKHNLILGHSLKPGNIPIDGEFKYGVYDVHYYSNYSTRPGLISYKISINMQRAFAEIGFLAAVVVTLLAPYVAPATAPAVGYAMTQMVA